MSIPGTGETGAMEVHSSEVSRANELPTPAPPLEPTCGHPTRDGSPCRRRPLGGGGSRCSRHAGLPSTEAERAAAKRAALKHGYYLSGFLDEDERELFQRVCDGQVDPGDIVRQMTAALYVRAMRMTFWESEDGEPSALTTAAFAELRQALARSGYGEVNRAYFAELREQREIADRLEGRRA